MFSGIPLPSILDITIPKQMNALNELEKQRLYNQNYTSDIQSQVGQRNALTQGQNIENQFMPDKLRLANQMSQMQNQMYIPKTQADINNLNALTNKTNTMTQLEAINQKNVNEWYARKAQADIDANKALSNWRNMGGSGMGTGAKDDLQFQNNVARDNPQLTTSEQLRSAADAYARGESQLPDGTQLNPMSEITKRSLDRAIKSTSSAKLVTAGVQANQADAELTALTNHTTPVIKDIGTTYFNMSPEQIISSFKSDDASQKKLGRIIGARSLQYAIAQLRNRIDMGEPGINATRELMDNSGQIINVVAPRLTGKAREEAQNFINEGVMKALKARNEYGIGASGATGRNKQKTPENTSSSDVPVIKFVRDSTGKLVRA